MPHEPEPVRTHDGLVEGMVDRILEDPDRLKSLLRNLVGPPPPPRVRHVRVIARLQLEHLPDWLDVRSFARDVGAGLVPVTRKSVSDACRAGALRAVKAPGHWRIDPTEVGSLRAQLQHALATVGHSVSTAYLFPYDPATGFRIFDVRHDRAVAIGVRLRY